MSPTVFRRAGYRFFFFSREESRMHVHVVSGDGEAKFWLELDVQLAKAHHYSDHQLRDIQGIVEDHYDERVSAWHDHFGR